MPQSRFGENVGQSELAARVGSLKGMLAEANSDFLAGSDVPSADFDEEVVNYAGIQYLRILAQAAVLQLEMAMSEPPGSLYKWSDGSPVDPAELQAQNDSRDLEGD